MIEVFTMGLLLLIPLVWLLGVLADLHRAALGASAAAREGASEVARADDIAAARRALDAAVQRAFANLGLPPRSARVRWSAGGLIRGAAVTVRVSYPVNAMKLPFVGAVTDGAIWLNATHVARVPRFGSR